MQLLRIRYLQVRRDLGYWVLILAAAAACFTYSFVSDDLQRNLFFIGVIAFGIYLFHGKRQDLVFLNNYFEKPLWQICINYNLTVLPFTFGLALNGLFQYALLLHVSVSLIPLFSFKSRAPKLLFVSRLIPKQHFEWIAGIRANFPVLLLLIVVTLFFSPVKLFALVGLFMFNSVFVGFYNLYEPLLMLNPEGLAIKPFLSKKVIFISSTIFFTNLPVLVINSIFQPDMAWFNLFFLCGFLLMGATGIYIKYGAYKPNATAGTSVDFLLLSVAVILPYLLPIAVYIYFSNLRKAKLNLLNYLDDKR